MIRIIIFCAMFFSAITQASTWKDEILYFVMLDRFADGDFTNNQDVDLNNTLAFHGGNLKGLREHLGEIKELGATAIWITPINQQVTHPISNQGGPFHPHHGYWANDFTQVDPRYGSEQDLKDLVTAAHGLGMKVILDTVYNHVGYGADWEKKKPEWLRTGVQCGGSRAPPFAWSVSGSTPLVGRLAGTPRLQGKRAGAGIDRVLEILNAGSLQRNWRTVSK